MAFSFNLIDQAWIPCLRHNGRTEELGLRETFAQAHTMREIRAYTPLETAALYRLLLAVLHRTFGPSDSDVWNKVWSRGQFDMGKLNEYLFQPKIALRFDLFGEEHRFYQAQAPRFVEKSVVKLLLHTASGNNATVFDHSTESEGRSLTPAEAARAVVTAQAFALGGLSGLGKDLPFTDAPCAKGTVFLVAGANLFETLVLNLLRCDTEKPLPSPDADDCPSWEMDDPFQPTRTEPNGYLDYLTWQNRRIWLLPEEGPYGLIVRKMRWSPGLVLDDHVVDPMKHYRADREGGWQPLCFTAERALWRDSAALLSVGSSHHPPLTVQWVQQLASSRRMLIGPAYRYQIAAFGIAKSKASLEFMRAEHMPLPPEMFSEAERVSQLGEAMRVVEGGGNQLSRAGFALAFYQLFPIQPDEALNPTDTSNTGKLASRISKGRSERTDDKDARRALLLAQSWGIERQYWAELEPHFHRFVLRLVDAPEAALAEWTDRVRAAAQSGFARASAYVGEDRRAMRAMALARTAFDIGLARVLGKARLVDQDEGDEADGAERE